MGNIQTKAAIVLQLLDLYTKKAVDTKNVRVDVKQQCKVILKEEGYVVILESPGLKELDICIYSGIYQSKQVKIVIQKEMNKNAYPIWLQPQKCYPFFSDTTFIKGIFLEGDFMISWENKEKPIRLVADYEKGSNIIQMINAGDYVAGRYYKITQKGQEEIFQLRGETEEVKQGYILEEPCKKGYKRAESTVVQMLPVEVSDNEFYIGIADIPKEGTKGKIYTNGRCIKELQIEYGKENVL